MGLVASEGPLTVGKPRVAVIGAGVAGLTVAHELSDRGFAVTVYEQRNQVGGKARSWSADLPETDELPAEHGFRFFPGFYKHVIDTMTRIPSDDGALSVADHLVEGDCALITDGNGRTLTTPLPTSKTHPTWRQRLKGALPFCKSLPGPWETACFVAALARLANSCERRWNHQLEQQSWLEYVMARRRSSKYRRLFAVGLTRTFVATRAEEMSARTGGRILLQLLYDSFIGPPTRGPADRVLDGPTSQVWIDPWYRHLTSSGVTFELGGAVTRLHLDARGWVRGFDLRRAGEPDSVEDDFAYYVLAVPCEMLKQLVVNTPELATHDRQLGRVFLLETRWMNGIVFGVDQKLESMPKGHVLCLDSPWALTLVDHSRLWSKTHLASLRNRWPTILSVDVSDWQSPGPFGLPAEWVPPPRHQLAERVWLQLQAHLPELATVPCPSDFKLDIDVKYHGSPTQVPPPPDIVQPPELVSEGLEQGAAAPTRNGEPIRPVAELRTNDEPLLVNTAGSWKNRPTANTTIPNLFLAGDYVQTYTDFASMEAANEAARRAVNALLHAHGSTAPCKLWPLEDPEVFWFRAPQRAARIADRLLFRLGLRAPFRIPILAWITLFVLSRLAGIALFLLSRLPGLGALAAPRPPAPPDAPSPAATP